MFVIGKSKTPKNCHFPGPLYLFGEFKVKHYFKKNNLINYSTSTMSKATLSLFDQMGSTDNAMRTAAEDQLQKMRDHYQDKYALVA